MAEPTTAIIASVLAIVVTFWTIDKSLSEGWQRWKKRVNRVKKLVAKLKDAANSMEEVKARIINKHLEQTTGSDINIDTVLEQAKSDIDEEVAKFIYSGFEIAAQTIKDGLGQWINEEAYKQYLTVKIKRIVAERERIALLTKSGGLETRIKNAETQIQNMEQQKQSMEVAKEKVIEKVMKEENLSMEDAKKKVEESIKQIVDKIREHQEEKAMNEAEKKRADDGADTFAKDIEEKKEEEVAHREEIWKKGE